MASPATFIPDGAPSSFTPDETSAAESLTNLKPSPYEEPMMAGRGRPETGMESGTDFTATMARAVPQALASAKSSAADALAAGIDAPANIYNRVKGLKPESKGYVAPIGKELISDAGTAAVKPFVPIPKFKPSADDDWNIASVKEAANMLLSIPEFMETPLGAATLGVGTAVKAASTPIRYAFASDMLGSMFQQAPELYRNWGSMTPVDKSKAITQFLGTGAMAALLTHPELTTKSKPVTEGPAATGNFLKTPEGAQPPTQGPLNAIPIRSATETALDETPGGSPQVGEGISQPEKPADAQTSEAAPNVPTEAAPVTLLPAINTPEGPIAGSPGETHADIRIRLASHDNPDVSLAGMDQNNSGFIDPKSPDKFLTRKEAGAIIKAQHPDFTFDEEKGLQSQDLQRLALQGEDAPFNLSGEKATDGERIAAEKAKAEKDKADAAALEKKQQPGLPGTGGIDTGNLGELGMGAAKPAEFEQGAGTPTSIKNATVDSERAKRGLPPAMQPARRSFGEVWDRAMAMIDQDPGDPLTRQTLQDKLIDELRAKPRALTDVEDALLLHRQIDLQNEYGKATRALAQAFDDGRADAMVEEKLRVGRLSDALLDLYNVGKRAGTETGRGLNARKMMAYEDFSLAKMTLDMRAARGGRPLTPAETAEIQRLHDEVQKTQKAYDDYRAKTDARIAEMEVKAAIDKIELEARQRPLVEPHVRIIADKIKVYFDNRADAALKRLSGKLFTLSPQVLADLTDLGVSRILGGAAKFAEWSIKMTEALGDRIKPHLQTVWESSERALNERIEQVAGGKTPAAEKVKRAVKGADISELETDAIEKIKAKVSAKKLDEINPLAQRLARIAVARGAKGWRAVNDAVHATLKNILPDWDYRDTLDAVSGHGKFSLPSKDAISKELSDAKAQTNEIRKIQEVISREPVKPTGFQRGLPSDAKRRLTKLYEEMKRRFGVSVSDPAVQLRSALQARKTYYEHRMADLQYEIDSGKRIVKTKSPTPTDSDLESKIAEYKQIKAEHDKIFGDRVLTDEQKLKMAIASAEKSATEYQRRIDAGEFTKGKKPSSVPETPELKAARARRDALKAHFEEMRSLDEHFQQEQHAAKLAAEKASLEQTIAEQERKLSTGDIAPKPGQVNRPADPTLEPLKQRRDALARQIAEARKKPADQKYAESLQRQLESLNKSIAEKEGQIASGDVAPKTVSKQNRPLPPELEQAKQRVEELNRQIAEMRKPKTTPEERALQSLKTRLTNRTAELEERIAKGDYTVRVRVPTPLDAEASRLKAINERVKKQFQRGVALERLKNAGNVERAGDWIVKWRRGFILSGPVTLAKLTSAAIQRLTITPIEEGVGAAIGKAFPGVAARAPRQGGVNVSAETKAITQALTQGMRDAWQVLRTGQSDLDVLYGKEALIPPSVVDFFGHIHGALKAPTKRAEFTRSLEKRTQAYSDAGVDVSDPMVQSRLVIESYKDANRSIFQQDNRVTSAYKRALQALEQKDKATGKPTLAGKSMATVAKVLLPIVKIPTNIVAETMEHATGLVTGSARLARAYRAGIENLKPEEADLIMRQLKKGSLGAAALALGYFNADVIGGYYQPGQKRDKKDVKAGHVKLFGQDIPSFLLHNPLLETLQIGATIRRVADSKLRKSDKETQGVPEGVMAAGLGLLMEVPFVREMSEIVKAFDPHTKGAFFGELGKSLLVPRGVQSVAEHFDKDAEGETVRRDPRTVVQHIETGVPGLRTTIPVKTGAPKPAP